MAFITNIYCHQCHQNKQEVADSENPYPNICGSCRAENATRAERQWKAGREGLTLEERIRDLEDFMYHHGTHYKPVRFG